MELRGHKDAERGRCRREREIQGTHDRRGRGKRYGFVIAEGCVAATSQAGLMRDTEGDSDGDVT